MQGPATKPMPNHLERYVWPEETARARLPRLHPWSPSRCKPATVSTLAGCKRRGRLRASGDASVLWTFALTMSLDNLDRKIYVLPGGQLLGLTRHKNADAAGVFDPTTAGLDHVGFNGADLAELESWSAYLTEHGVANSGVQDTDYGQLVSFKDPDGNDLQVYAPPSDR